jgi:hypothetical protein
MISQKCIHSKRPSKCIECDGSEVCMHSRQKSHCVDCTTFEAAASRGWICKICAVTKTRAGVCRRCFNQLTGSSNITMEAVVLKVGFLVFCCLTSN